MERPANRGALTAAGQELVRIWRGEQSGHRLGKGSCHRLEAALSFRGIALDGSGQIARNTQISSTVTRPFLKRTWDGTWIFPSSMPPTLDGNWATARAINDRGQIVAEAKDFGNNSRAFIWIPYLQNITDLNSYLSASQQLSWTLLVAY